MLYCFAMVERILDRRDYLENEHRVKRPSCLKKRIYRYTRKEHRKVVFTNNPTTDEWESVWCCKDELMEYLQAMKEKIPRASHEVKEVRKLEHHIQREISRKQQRAIRRFFTVNPLGVVQDEDSRTFHQLTREVDNEVKKIQEELRFAPTLFKNIHPFDEALVTYFNSTGKSRLDRLANPDVYRGCGRGRLQPIYPVSFFPLEIERKLWRYRQFEFRRYYTQVLNRQGESDSNYLHVSETLQRMAANGADEYVADPFSYFEEQINYNDHLMTRRQVEDKFEDSLAREILPEMEMSLPEMSLSEMEIELQYW